MEEYTKDHAPDLVYDDVLLPALYFTKQDRERDNITDADVQFAIELTRDLLDDLAHDRVLNSAAATDLHRGIDGRSVRVVLAPVRDELDAAALAMVGQLIERDGGQVELLAAAMLTSEVLEHVGETRPDVCCVGCVAPGGLNHTRHLCKRLRARFPDLKLVVGRWGLHDERYQQPEHPLLSNRSVIARGYMILKFARIHQTND